MPLRWSLAVLNLHASDPSGVNDLMQQCARMDVVQLEFQVAGCGMELSAESGQ